MFITNEKVLILIIKIAIISLTAILNGMLIFIYTISIKKRTFSDLIYLSIGLSDFIIGFMSMSTQSILDQFDDEWPFDKFTCFISIYLQYAIPDTTILALLVLALHIYVQLTSRSKVIESFNCKNLIKLICPWLVATLFWTVSIFIFILNNSYSIKRCNIEPNFIFKLIKVCVFGYLPLFLIILINFLSIKQLNKKRNVLLQRIL